MNKMTLSDLVAMFTTARTDHPGRVGRVGVAYRGSGSESKSRCPSSDLQRWRSERSMKWPYNCKYVPPTIAIPPKVKRNG